MILSKRPLLPRARVFPDPLVPGTGSNSNHEVLHEHHAAAVDRMGRRHNPALSASCLPRHPDPLRGRPTLPRPVFGPPGARTKHDRAKSQTNPTARPHYDGCYVCSIRDYYWRVRVGRNQPIQVRSSFVQPGGPKGHSGSLLILKYAVDSAPGHNIHTDFLIHSE